MFAVIRHIQKIFIEFLLSAMPLYLTVNTACGEPLEIIYQTLSSATISCRYVNSENCLRESLLSNCHGRRRFAANVNKPGK
jgi:hypothetical protein